MVTDAAVECELEAMEHVNTGGIQLKQWNGLPADFDQPFPRGTLSWSPVSVNITNNFLTSKKILVKLKFYDVSFPRIASSTPRDIIAKMRGCP